MTTGRNTSNPSPEELSPEELSPPRVGQLCRATASTGSKPNTNQSVRNNTARSEDTSQPREWEVSENRQQPAFNRRLAANRGLREP